MHNEFYKDGDYQGWGYRLRTCRERHGWSQEELASKVSVTRPAIAQYEAAYDPAHPDKFRWPRPWITSELARVLGVSPVWLAYGVEDASRGLKHDTDPKAQVASRMASMVEIQMNQKNKAIFFDAWGGTCAICEAAPAHHIDHVIPRYLGGTDALGNRVPACEECNTRKGARLLPDAETADLLRRADEIAPIIADKIQSKKTDLRAKLRDLRSELVALRLEDRLAALGEAKLTPEQVKDLLRRAEAEIRFEVEHMSTISALRTAISNAKGDRERAKREARDESIARTAETLYPDLIAAGTERGMSARAARDMADKVLADHRITREGWMQTCIRHVRAGKGIPKALGARPRPAPHKKDHPNHPDPRWE